MLLLVISVSGKRSLLPQSSSLPQTLVLLQCTLKLQLLPVWENLIALWGGRGFIQWYLYFLGLGCSDNKRLAAYALMRLPDGLKHGDWGMHLAAA